MSRLTNDLAAVRALFGPGLLNLFNTALVYATALALLLQLSPRLTLLALIPYPLLLVAARAREPPHPPGQPRDPGPAGDDVDGDPGGPGGDRGHQALRAGGGAPAGVPRRERRVSDAGAGAGAGARRADAAVRDAGRHRDADRAVGGRARGDRGADDASAAWSRSTATWCCCRGRRSRSAGSSASGSAAWPAGRACASCSTREPGIADAPDAGGAGRGARAGARRSRCAT